MAVVAIGLVGIMALFPLGMDAVRQAADSTQMMAISQDTIAYYQQFTATNPWPSSPSEVYPSGTYSTNQSADGIWYRTDATVINSGFSTITFGGTNMISRVRIGIYRVKDSTDAHGISSTNYYFTEVDRYVQ